MFPMWLATFDSSPSQFRVVNDSVPGIRLDFTSALGQERLLLAKLVFNFSRFKIPRRSGIIGKHSAIDNHCFKKKIKSYAKWIITCSNTGKKSLQNTAGERCLFLLKVAQRHHHNDRFFKHLQTQRPEK